jgi:hypothetical protein
MNKALNRIKLPELTIVSIDTDPISQSLTRAAILRTLAILEPSCVIHFGREPLGVGETFVRINRFASIDDYSEFVFKCLWPFCATEKIMIVHWDGHPANACYWDPEFINCDYIGAPWAWAQDQFRIGNGGFSIRSKRLMELCKNVQLRRHPEIPYANAEDIVIGRIYRRTLEDAGLSFASDELATQFSYETGPLREDVFGFHAPSNMPLFVSEDDLLETVDDLKRKIVGKFGLEQFTKHAQMRGYHRLMRSLQP